MNKPFWEESYKDDDATTFGKEPNPTIKERWTLFTKNGTVLDVGCGEGKNAIFLAKKGFVVDAFDISESGIEKLKRLALKNHVKVNAWVQNLLDYTSEKQYDVVTSHGTLHFIPKQEWKNFILKVKKQTKSGGVHIMQIFTNTIPASPDIAPFVKGLADEGELFELYDDWKIIETKSYVFEDEHPGVKKHLHASNKIVAIK